MIKRRLRKLEKKRASATCDICSLPDDVLDVLILCDEGFHLTAAGKELVRKYPLSPIEQKSAKVTAAPSRPQTRFEEDDEEELEQLTRYFWARLNADEVQPYIVENVQKAIMARGCTDD